MKHLKENNIGYFRHMKRAFYFSYNLILAGILCFIHGIYPDIFTYTASNIIKKLERK